MSDKREYSKFQLKIIALFEEEIVTRLDKAGSAIESEDDIARVVDACYEELYLTQTDIETGVIDVCKAPDGTLTH